MIHEDHVETLTGAGSGIGRSRAEIVELMCAVPVRRDLSETAR